MKSAKIRLIIGLAVSVALGLVFVASLFVSGISALAQSDVDIQKGIDEAVLKREAELRAELDKVLAEIEVQSAILSEKQKEGVSLERDLAILTARITEARLKIKAHNIAIEALGKDIKEKTKVIGELSLKIQDSQESLSELIRQTNELDHYTLVEILLGNENLSDFFADLDTFEVLKDSMRASFLEVRDTRDLTEVEKNSLDRKRLLEIDEKVSVEEEKRKIERDEAEKERLLNLSKAEQQSYQDVIDEREARAAEIRSALFLLRDSAAIPFGDALAFAESASNKTGVRPAFILAILMQESELGKNIGTCNREGDPPEKHWREIMKPSRDHEPYLRITKALGLNPDVMPLSCPWGNGWGGAMGPSQFIPSTWEMYETRLANALGVKVPSPWEPKHAIMATAMFVADLGADLGGYSAEREAALRYYAGGNWWKDSNAFYGNQVMAKAVDIQETMIDPLKGL